MKFKRRNKMNEYNVGDRVKITSSGHGYTNVMDLAKRLGLQNYQLTLKKDGIWAKDTHDNEFGVIVSSDVINTDYGVDTAYGIRLDTRDDRSYEVDVIMNSQGIERVK